MKPNQLLPLLAVFSLSRPMDCSALTAKEQASAFVARGTAAEARGDFLIADNCYQLALRASPGLPEAQQKLAALLVKLSGHLLGVRLGFTLTESRQYTVQERVDNLQIELNSVTAQRKILTLVINDPTGALHKKKVPLLFREQPLWTGEVFLKAICEKTGATWKLENNQVIISPAGAPPLPPGGTTPGSPAIEPASPASLLAERILPSAVTTSLGAAPAVRGSDITALDDGKVPERSDDNSLSRFTWQPRQGTYEWAEYTFSSPQHISGCAVFWAEKNGRVLLPDAWKLLYRDAAGAWLPVSTRPAGTVPDQWNLCRFQPVRTTGMRLAIQAASYDSPGLYEWAILPHTGPAPAAAPRPAELWLDDLIPVSASTGGRKNYRTNKFSETEEKKGAQVLLDGKPLTRYLFANADSAVVFDIPAGYGTFTATGTGPVMTGRTEYSWLYRVQVDGKQVYESPRLDTCQGQRVDIRIELPPGCKKLTLLTDGLGIADGDHAFWANAKLTLAKASPEIQAKLDALEKQYLSAPAVKAYEKTMTTLRVSYAAALKRAAEKAAKDADEAAAKALAAETAVLAQGSDPPATDAPQDHNALTALRATWRKSAAAEAAKLFPLLDIYEKDLTTLEQSATGQNATAISARRQDTTARRTALQVQP